jgi:hypothetical protein
MKTCQNVALAMRCFVEIATLCKVATTAIVLSAAHVRLKIDPYAQSATQRFVPPATRCEFATSATLGFVRTAKRHSISVLAVVSQFAKIARKTTGGAARNVASAKGSCAGTAIFCQRVASPRAPVANTTNTSRAHYSLIFQTDILVFTTMNIILVWWHLTRFVPCSTVQEVWPINRLQNIWQTNP